MVAVRDWRLAVMLVEWRGNRMADPMDVLSVASMARKSAWQMAVTLAVEKVA